MSEFPDNPFWDFSLALYRETGVEEACIGLQDRLGLDVNLLLYGCWIAATGRGRPAHEDWTRLIEATAGWRTSVVEPLRAVRRHLKGRDDMTGAAALRDRVKALELDAEHAEQLAIAGYAPAETGDPSDEADVAATLRDYVQAAGARPTDADLADLGILARAAIS